MTAKPTAPPDETHPLSWVLEMGDERAPARKETPKERRARKAAEAKALLERMSHRFDEVRANGGWVIFDCPIEDEMERISSIRSPAAANGPSLDKAFFMAEPDYGYEDDPEAAAAHAAWLRDYCNKDRSDVT